MNRGVLQGKGLWISTQIVGLAEEDDEQKESRGTAGKGNEGGKENEFVGSAVQKKFGADSTKCEVLVYPVWRWLAGPLNSFDFCARHSVLEFSRGWGYFL